MRNGVNLHGKQYPSFSRPPATSFDHVKSFPKKGTVTKNTSSATVGPVLCICNGSGAPGVYEPPNMRSSAPHPKPDFRQEQNTAT